MAFPAAPRLLGRFTVVALRACPISVRSPRHPSGLPQWSTRHSPYAPLNPGGGPPCTDCPAVASVSFPTKHDMRKPSSKLLQRWAVLRETAIWSRSGGALDAHHSPLSVYFLTLSITA